MSACAWRSVERDKRSCCERRCGVRDTGVACSSWLASLARARLKAHPALRISVARGYAGATWRGEFQVAPPLMLLSLLVRSPMRYLRESQVSGRQTSTSGAVVVCRVFFAGRRRRRRLLLAVVVVVVVVLVPVSRVCLLPSSGMLSRPSSSRAVGPSFPLARLGSYSNRNALQPLLGLR